MGRNLLRALAGGFMVAAATMVAAADAQQGGPPELSPASRQKLADVHDRMAACLRSDKPIAQCRSEMLKNCQEMMGKEGCPMMGPGGGGMGPGMMGGRMPGGPVNPGPPK